MNRNIAAYLAAFGTVFLWGMSYIWADRLLDIGIALEFFVPVRILAAGLLLLILNLLLGYDMRIRRRDVLKFCVLAFCMPFIYFIAETYGILFTDSPTITSLVVATNPIFAVATGMLVFKEKFSRVNIAGVLVTLLGLWQVIYTRTCTGPNFVWGVLILFVAVASEVCQIAFTKALSSSYKPSVIVMYQFLLGSVFFMPLFLTKGLEGFEASVWLSLDVLMPIAALAILCSATAFTLWAFAIKKLGVARTSIFLAIVPLITAVLSSLFGGDKLCGPQWAGLATAMVGIYLTQRKPSGK